MANLWWAIVRDRQYEPGFGWKDFKELLKSCFYPVSLEKAKDDEFVHLQQGRRSVLEHASKFVELSHFAPVYVADKKLRMDRFEAWLNPILKEQMSAW